MTSWLPIAGWLEWSRDRWTPREVWIPMTPETKAEVAAACQFIVDALPNTEPLCARCGRPMPRHVLLLTFGESDGTLICP